MTTMPALIVKVSTWVPTTLEMLEDAARIRRSLDELFRLAELADRGFGPVRCVVCRRRLRCVYAFEAGQHYGRDCFLRTIEAGA